MALTAFLITLVVSIAIILFHAYFLQVIYNLALIPIFGLFEIQLPQMTYGIFILIWICYICFVKLFIKKETKITYNANDPQDVASYLAKLLGTAFTIILEKLFYLLIVYITYKIFFV